MPTKPIKKPAPKAKAAPAKKESPMSVVPFSPMAASMCSPSSSNNFESVEKIMSSAKSQYEKMSGDAGATSRQGVEAWTKSASCFAKGAESMMKTMMSMAQENSERSSSAWKSLLAAKTITEMSEAQNKLAQQSFEDAMAAATKISEMTIKLCTESLEPINDQVTKTVKKASEGFAA